MNNYSRYQFTLFRFFLGVGFFFYFLLVYPYAPDLTESNSIGINLDTLYLPDLLEYLNSMQSVKFFMIALATCSALLALGIARRWMAGLILLAFIFTIHRIPLMPWPKDGYALFALLAAILTPHGEALTLLPLHKDANAQKWNVPIWYRRVFGWVLATTLIFFGWFSIQRSLITQNPPAALISLGYFCAGLLYCRKNWRIFSLGLALLVFGFFPACNNLGLFFVSLAVLIFAFDQRTLLPWQVHIKKPSDIFIDGECVLCNGFAEFLLKEDVHRFFRIASLQGNYAKSFLPERIRAKVHTVVLHDSDHTYTKSGAVIRIVSRLGGIWGLVSIFLLIPAPIRDLIYDGVAAIRYRTFGKYDVCRLPTAEERGRVLD